jgi:hypothetical protein
MRLETGYYAVSGNGVRSRVIKQLRLRARQLRSLLRLFDAEHLIDQIGLLAKRQPGRPKKRG